MQWAAISDIRIATVKWTSAVLFQVLQHNRVEQSIEEDRGYLFCAKNFAEVISNIIAYDLPADFL